MDAKIDNSPKKDGYPLIPDESIKCVWMTAGLISYKLCKYDLQCEKCPLDWELRNLSSAPSFDSTAPPEITHLKTEEKLTPPPPEREAEEEEGAREDLRRLKIKEDLYYHSGHTWIKVEKGDEVRIGIDRFLGGLIGKATAVILPLLGGRSKQGESLCSIIQEEGMLHIVSPISGFILSVNQRLKDRPSLLNRDPEGEGFLMTLTPKHLQRDQPNFFSGEGALSWYRKEWERFKTEVISELPIRQKWLGMTMQDGEVTLRDIKQLIGPQRYIRLVNTFLRRGEKASPDTKA